MNIFVLDKNPEFAAQMHCDKHVIKMVLETAQLLSTAIWDAGDNAIHRISMEKKAEYISKNYPLIYKPTHRKHPCTIWASKNSTRFRWLKKLGLALCKEYTLRYNKTHKSQAVIESLQFPIFDACWIEPPLEPFVQAMPDEYKDDDAVTAYRNYYRGAKSKILVYTNREPPDWIADIARIKNG